MRHLNGIALACTAFVAAQPALASRNLEGLVLNTFMQRCMTPMIQSMRPDVTGLTLPEGAEQIGTPGSTIRFENLDGPTKLRIETGPKGEVSCALSVDMPDGFDTQQIIDAVAANLTEAGFTKVQSCQSDIIGKHGIFLRDAQPDSAYAIGVMSFVIPGGDVLPDQLSLISAELGDPDPSAFPCPEDEETKP